MEKKELRNGYTTGSCAAAAAKAAAMELLTGSCSETVAITLPGGTKAQFKVQKINVDDKSSPVSCFCVQKDSGDDPDVTDGSYICAACRTVSPSEMQEFKADGKGYFMEGESSIYIDGGPGVGLITREGLSCPVGHYAINPVPRSEITSAVREVCYEAGWTGNLLINIAVPEGEVMAAKTFNPRLGITGGISILGTSGIVRPMSEEAVLETIRLELHMRSVSGNSGVILVPGNYGETFLKERLGIPEGTAVQISNFVRDSVLMACDEGFDKILFTGHTGKLIKVAAGFQNTHSRYGDKRMETFAALLEKVNVHETRVRDDIMSANTTDEALSMLKKAYPAGSENIVRAFLDELAYALKRQMEEWAGEKLITEVIVFSREGDIGATQGVRDYFSL